MQLVEEELFRDLLTTGVMVLVNNLINISYPTTQFFFSLAYRINVITDSLHYPHSFEKHKKIFHSEVSSITSALPCIFDCQGSFDILMSSSHFSPQDIRFRRLLYFQSKNKHLQDGRLKLTPTICSFLVHSNLVKKPSGHGLQSIFYDQRHF